MGDLLSAASLALAGIAALYGLWHNQISLALGVQPARHAEDRPAQVRIVQPAYLQRALPLAVAAVGMTSILAPESMRILVDAVRLMALEGFGALRHYDAVRASIVFVNGLTLLLAFQSTRQALSLSRLLKRLRAK